MQEPKPDEKAPKTMKKREALLALLALGVAPWAARAQQPGKVWRIGFLAQTNGMNENIAAFVDGLRNLGYVEGKNLSIEYRFAAGNVDRLPAMAEELVGLKVDLIATNASTAPAIAKRATSTIPIVMNGPSDPVGSGLVASLAHPGGNLTGTSILSTELSGKHLLLLRELRPNATRIAVLIQGGRQDTTGPLFIEQIEAATKTSGMTLLVRQARDLDTLTRTVTTLQRERVQALIVQHTAFADTNRKIIVEAVAKQRLPAIYGSRGFVDAGGLMSYGPNLPAVFRRAAYFVDRIFKGAKPADLPVEQPTVFEMVVNLKTAKALGITVAQSLLLQANEVIK